MQSLLNSVFYVLTALFTLSSTAAAAKKIELKDPGLKLLTFASKVSSGGELDDVPMRACGIAAGPKIENCFEGQDLLELYITQAQLRIDTFHDTIVSEVKKINQNTRFEDQWFLNNLKSLTKCMKQAARKASFICHDSPDPHNEKIWARSYRLDESRSLWPKRPKKWLRRIHLFPLIFELEQKDFVGTLIHEISHHCGTSDTMYLGKHKLLSSDQFVYTRITTTDDPAHPQSLELDASFTNADHIVYWTTVGFCSPLAECYQRD